MRGFSIRIHIIDLSKTQESYPRFQRDFGPEHDCLYINGFKDRHPDSHEVDVLVLTGSEYSITEDYSWLEPLLDYVRTFFETGRPMLGVCYSHQLIARALCGRMAVSQAAVPEMTYTPVEVTKPNLLFKGLPNPFWVMSAHYDQVVRLPDDFEGVARTRDCAIQAMVHKTKPVVGLQFHPEIEPERGRKCVRDEWEKLKGHGLEPDSLLAQIPSAPTGADVVLRNFLSFVS